MDDHARCVDDAAQGGFFQPDEALEDDGGDGVELDLGLKARQDLLPHVADAFARLVDDDSAWENVEKSLDSGMMQRLFYLRQFSEKLLLFGSGHVRSGFLLGIVRGQSIPFISGGFPTRMRWISTGDIREALPRSINIDRRPHLRQRRC